MDSPVCSLSRAMLRGSIGFTAVSLAAFSVWAFAGRSLTIRFGEGGFYAVCALVFLGGAGLCLYPLAQGPKPLAQFYRVFIPAFLGYAVAWCLAWFAFGFGLGEWLGSFAGSVIFALIAGALLGSLRGLFPVVTVLFVLHSAGYFLGGKLMYWLAGPAGRETFTMVSPAQLSVLAKLGWGLLYGLGFGAGVGYAFYRFQSKPDASCKKEGGLPAPSPASQVNFDRGQSGSLS